MEIEVGNEVYSVRVFEIYVVKVSSSVQCSCPGKKPDRKSSSKTSANSLESSTTSKHKEKSESSGDNPIGTDEAINAVFLGKSSHGYANSADKGASRSLGVPELVCGRFEALSGDNISAGSSLRQKGAVSSKNICVDCSLNVPGPKGDISQTQANPIAIRVSVRASPMGFSSWDEFVELVNNALFLSQKREGSSSSQSEVEKEDLAEDFIPEDFNLASKFAGLSDETCWWGDPMKTLDAPLSFGLYWDSSSSGSLKFTEDGEVDCNKAECDGGFSLSMKENSTEALVEFFTSLFELVEVFLGYCKLGDFQFFGAE
ncbi:hypothetical protein V6N11_070785 [Hibiscus sabdariffa]|uniref:Uncharacterized protein n=1 Tax=Hibiscus sabdariffa TaxID=183260 RepID=A0ABR2QG17_9ROSI